MDTPFIEDFSPSLALREHVRKYQVFRLLFKKEALLPTKYHTPHPEHCLTFYPRDLQRYSHLRSPTVGTYPRCVINGFYNVPLNRHGGHDFLAIKVVFQPTTLFCLTGIPSQQLTNTFLDAQAVWGKEVGLVCQRLTSAQTLPEMLLILEKFLAYLFGHRLCQSGHAVDQTSRLMLHQPNAASLAWLADQSSLSIRQFIRKFEQRLGISPKMFERIVRFDRAYRMKNAAPDLDWLSIALSCGYYDHQHLVRDYKEFTGLTPQSLFELERKSPERTFGLFEY
ncbi:MAG: AraC family transcriptional regulator [Ferruginibacter sp.]|nr:AraC family transcriptional regulator [Cytophagales bacterium]